MLPPPPTYLIAERFIESYRDMDEIEAVIKTHDGGLRFIQSQAFSDLRSAAVFVPDERTCTVYNQQFTACLARTPKGKRVTVGRWNYPAKMVWDDKKASGTETAADERVGWWMLGFGVCVLSAMVWRARAAQSV